MIELIKMEGMIVVSNNNFKDDFEKNRQSINPDEHQTELKEDDKTNENKKKLTLKTVYLITQINNFLRNAQRRKRRRETATNQSKQQDDKHQKIVTLKLQKVH